MALNLLEHSRLTSQRTTPFAPASPSSTFRSFPSSTLVSVPLSRLRSQSSVSRSPSSRSLAPSFVQRLLPLWAFRPSNFRRAVAQRRPHHSFFTVPPPWLHRQSTLPPAVFRCFARSARPVRCVARRLRRKLPTLLSARRPLWGSVAASRLSSSAPADIDRVPSSVGDPVEEGSMCFMTERVRQVLLRFNNDVLVYAFALAVECRCLSMTRPSQQSL